MILAEFEFTLPKQKLYHFMIYWLQMETILYMMVFFSLLAVSLQIHLQQTLLFIIKQCLSYLQLSLHDLDKFLYGLLCKYVDELVFSNFCISSIYSSNSTFTWISSISSIWL